MLLPTSTGYRNRSSRARIFRRENPAFDGRIRHLRCGCSLQTLRRGCSRCQSSPSNSSELLHRPRSRAALRRRQARGYRHLSGVGRTLPARNTTRRLCGPPRCSDSALCADECVRACECGRACVRVRASRCVRASAGVRACVCVRACVRACHEMRRELSEAIYARWA